MNENLLANSVSPEAVAKSGKTSFRVFITAEGYGGVHGFLDRYFGKEYEIVGDPKQASLHILVALEDGRFLPSDVFIANEIFDRDGEHARVYEYDTHDQQLKARTRDYINRRSLNEKTRQNF